MMNETDDGSGKEDEHEDVGKRLDKRTPQWLTLYFDSVWAIAPKPLFGLSLRNTSGPLLYSAYVSLTDW